MAVAWPIDPIQRRSEQRHAGLRNALQAAGQAMKRRVELANRASKERGRIRLAQQNGNIVVGGGQKLAKMGF